MRTIIARRGQWQVLESPGCVEAAHIVIERVSDNACAADNIGYMERSLKRIRHEIGGVALSLIVFVYGKLAEQKRWHGIGAIALLRFWKEGALDL